MAFDRELEFARAAAISAGDNAIRIQTTGISAKVKPDGSPVTTADTDNERLLRELIEAAYPDDGILGEEGTRKEGNSGRRWILDPIDGTRDFIKGKPDWCVLIALEERGEPVVGVAHFPLLAESYWASRGAGAYQNGELLRLSGVEGHSETPMSQFLSLLWMERGFGSGQTGGWFERRGAIWDLAAPQVIVEEAGGRCFAPDGSRRNDAGSAIACTTALESQVRTFLGLA